MLVCDSCGHVAAHDTPPLRSLPLQPKGVLAHVEVQVSECRNAGCHCDRQIPRPLLPSEPAL